MAYRRGRGLFQCMKISEINLKTIDRQKRCYRKYKLLYSKAIKKKINTNYVRIFI